MLQIRSFFFNLFYMLWTPLIAAVLLPVGLLCRKGKFQHIVPIIWAKGVMFFARFIMGIRYEIRGSENLTTNSATLYASKHQSAWETVAFWLLVEEPVYVLKKELLKIPFFGQYLQYLVHTIAIDRSAGASALKMLVQDTRAQLDAGRQVVIFPEGTRTLVGAEPGYQPGIAALYSQLNVPVTPVALNSGVYWAKNSFCKRPGTIVIEFLPPIPAGMKRKEFHALLQKTIEDASNRLQMEAPTLS